MTWDDEAVKACALAVLTVAFAGLVWTLWSMWRDYRDEVRRELRRANRLHLRRHGSPPTEDSAMEISTRPPILPC